MPLMYVECTQNTELWPQDAGTMCKKRYNAKTRNLIQISETKEAVMLAVHNRNW